MPTRLPSSTTRSMAVSSGEVPRARDQRQREVEPAGLGVARRDGAQDRRTPRDVVAALQIEAHVHLAVGKLPQLRHDHVLFRYRHADDFGMPETSFTVCSLWYVRTLHRLGRQEEAREVFEHLLKKRNHLGLLSEDIHPVTGELWGNFPQTYSMVGLIQAARTLSRPWELLF